MNINVIRHVSTPCLCQTSFPLSPVFVTEFGRRRVRRTCNKSELNVILSLHVCGNIHIELALLMKEIYSTRCFSDNAQVIFFSLHGATSSNRSRAPNYRAFEITFRHTTLVISPKHRHLPDKTQRSQETDRHIRNPSKPAAADPRLRTRNGIGQVVLYICLKCGVYTAQIWSSVLKR